MATTVSCTTVEPLLSICCSQLSGTIEGDQCVLSLANNPTVGGRFQGCANGETSTCSDGSAHDSVSGGLGVTSPSTGGASATSAVGGEDPSASSATGMEGASTSSDTSSDGSAVASDGSSESSDSASPSASPTESGVSSGSSGASETVTSTDGGGADGAQSGSYTPQTLKSSDTHTSSLPSPTRTAGAAVGATTTSHGTSGRIASSSDSPKPSSSARVERRISALALLGAAALALVAN